MRTPKAFRAVAAALRANDKAAALAAIGALSAYNKDLLVECRACGASEMQPCTFRPDEEGGPTKDKPEVVHFGRRVVRLLRGIK